MKNNDLEYIRQLICGTIQNGNKEAVHNSELIKTIDLLGGYLNAQTVAKWAKSKGIDYTTAKYRINRDKLETFELSGVTFLVDND